jgi:hypothetical protein
LFTLSRLSSNGRMGLQEFTAVFLTPLTVQPNQWARTHSTIGSYLSEVGYSRAWRDNSRFSGEVPLETFITSAYLRRRTAFRPLQQVYFYAVDVKLLRSSHGKMETVHYGDKKFVIWCAGLCIYMFVCRMCPSTNLQYSLRILNYTTKGRPMTTNFYDGLSESWKCTRTR